MASNKGGYRGQDRPNTAQQTGSNRATPGRAMHTKQQPANDEHSNNRRKPGRNGASATLRVPPNNDNGKHHKHAIGGGIIDRDSGPGRRKDSCHWDMVSFTRAQGQYRQRHNSVAKHPRIPHKREFVIRPRGPKPSCGLFASRARSLLNVGVEAVARPSRWRPL